MASRLSEIIRKHEAAILDEWVEGQQRRLGPRAPKDARVQSEEFLRLFADASADGDTGNVASARWAEVRELLGSLSRTRGQQGFSPSETATFVFALKQPLFTRLRDELEKGDPKALADELWSATEVLDALGLYTTEVHQRGREDVINRQQQDMLELSTPVVKLWDGILALPMIGTLDSARTQVVMETLLQRIVETGSQVAILDITGVPTVDTLVAQHLLKTVAAARLMGAECIISGIRPQIAQTIVHLGVDLGTVVTKGTLADAFAHALTRAGLSVAKRAAAKKPRAASDEPG